MALLNPENLQKMQAQSRKRKFPKRTWFESMADFKAHLQKIAPITPPQALPAPKIEIPVQDTTPEQMPGKLIKMPPQEPYRFYIHPEDRLVSN